MLGQGSVESRQEGVVVLLPGIKQSLLLQGGGGEVGDSDVLVSPLVFLVDWVVGVRGNPWGWGRGSSTGGRGWLDVEWLRLLGTASQ